jgi:broad-specificity NMP kinase
MIVIINGPCGIGKTSVAWALNARFERAVMLDGDYLGTVHPFEIYTMTVLIRIVTLRAFSKRC